MNIPKDRYATKNQFLETISNPYFRVSNFSNLLGRKVIQPVNLFMTNLPDGLHSQELRDWCAVLPNRLSDPHHHARQNLQESQLQQKRDYDIRIVEHLYNPGDIV